MKMSKILNVLKKKWMLFLLLAALFCILLYLFVPRNLGTLADIHDADIQKITLYGIFLDDKEGDLIIELTETEQQKFLEMMKKTYVFRNPIDKEYTEDDFGYFFELARKPVNRDTVPPLVHYFTEDIISVDDVQYRFYGDAFEEWFEELVDRD